MIRSKKFRIITVIAVVIVALALLFTVALLFRDKLFILHEKLNIGKKPVEYTECSDVLTLREYTYEELRTRDDVAFDTSLMLVNKTHYLPNGYTPELSEYKDTGVIMGSIITEPYGILSQSIKDRFDKKLYVSSSYRTDDEQAALYEEDPIIATNVGASEHQTGLALDVYVAYYSGKGFIKSEVGRYINTHAQDYGFIIRYPNEKENITGIPYEPWHIRYVGHIHAKIIYNNSLTLEEYIAGLTPNEFRNYDDHIISRQPEGDTLILPEGDYKYIISTDNTGYVIITAIPVSE